MDLSSQIKHIASVYGSQFANRLVYGSLIYSQIRKAQSPQFMDPWHVRKYIKHIAWVYGSRVCSQTRKAHHLSLWISVRKYVNLIASFMDPKFVRKYVKHTVSVYGSMACSQIHKSHRLRCSFRKCNHANHRAYLSVLITFMTFLPVLQTGTTYNFLLAWRLYPSKKGYTGYTLLK